ncbi:MAG: hypothetical protein QXW98_07695 [Candidatus Caldarchaeum sp.]
MDTTIERLDSQLPLARQTEIANTLADVVRKQGWTINIEGRHYVRVEGWQLLATLLGCTPYITDVRREERDDGAYAYIARAEIRRLSDGFPVASGEGLCRSDEQMRRRDGLIVERWHDEFAIRAMAQTRAIARAMRNAFGGIVALAGYQPTPAEEMVSEESQPSPPQQQQAPVALPQAQRQATPQVRNVQSQRDAAVRRLFSALRDAGYDPSDRDMRLRIASDALGREVDTYTTLTVEDVERIIDYVKSPPKPQPAPAPEPQPAPEQASLPPALQSTPKRLPVTNAIGWIYLEHRLKRDGINPPEFAAWLQALHGDVGNWDDVASRAIDAYDDYVARYREHCHGW